MPIKTTQPSQFVELTQSNLVEQVKDKLLAAIVSGELAPGDRVVEADLARRMGISRGPVREAARLLQQLGVLSSQARRGFFVRRVTLEEIEDLDDYRICIESYAAKKAVSRATQTEIGHLRELYNEVLAAEKRFDTEPLGALDATLNLHRYIFEICGNPRLAEAFENIVVQIRQIATLVNLKDVESETFFGRYLLQVVEAFESGDPQRVEKTIVSYLSFNRDQVKRFYTDYYQNL
ncbi:MAG: GntR family transcriptional regulator [Alphaproteobacteria bacterium]